ncbi:hypothetical protein U91I_01563 [alpha proteobacterium U9-1i]|nr:hypothetical protein U91I_01563 [alpha proteobacterium U9-1i]
MVRAIRVCFFGDSICVGQDVTLHKTWVVRTSRALSEHFAPRGIEIVVSNPSVNGNTTRQALERMAFDVQSRAVDVLIIQFGLNDLNYWDTDRGVPRVTREAFAANLAEMAARGRANGARDVSISTNHPTTRKDARAGLPTSYQADNELYNVAIRDVASATGAGLNDVEAHVFDLTERDAGAIAKLVLADGLHLSEAGHDLYADFMTPRAIAAVNRVLASVR